MENLQHNTGDISTVRDHAGKFLSFFLKDEEYGIEILKVREIIGMLPITRVPRTPDHVKGVINLRGKIIPVTDLRSKFGMEEMEKTAENCTIVVKSGGIEIGVIVDRVSEVVDIASSDIEPIPSFGSDVNTKYLLGIGNTNGRVRLLLDIDFVIAEEELSAVRKLAESTASAEA
jgi:purine-binding chemotaxis protein CheW